MAGSSLPEYSRFILITVSVLLLSVMLHEGAHMLTAAAFGVDSKLGYGIRTPVHVTLEEDASRASLAAIAISGPLTNLLIAVAFHVSRYKSQFAIVARNTNYLLFAINILPVPGLDGWTFLKNTLRAFA